MEKFAIYKTKLGFFLITYQDDKLLSLKKIFETPDNFGEKSDFSDLVYKSLIEYFEGTKKEFNFKLSPKGTPFQKRVWEELSKIPYGETRSYKDIAVAIGNPKASRAIGMANNKNPISIIVPCHRVIGSNGKLVGYASGLDLKKMLLDLESKS